MKLRKLKFYALMVFMLLLFANGADADLFYTTATPSNGGSNRVGSSGAILKNDSGGFEVKPTLFTNLELLT